MRHRRCSPRALRAAFLVCACGLLASCLTLSVWGFELRTEDHDSTWQFCPESWDDMPWWQRLLLTPFTLVVDCATWPLQCWLFEDDDDCDRHHRSR